MNKNQYRRLKRVTFFLIFLVVLSIPVTLMGWIWFDWNWWANLVGSELVFLGTLVFIHLYKSKA